MAAKPRVLLVDDNDDILSFLKDDLEEHYEIFTAYDGKEALSVMAENCIHLVVSDIMMPVMDGYALCQQLKADMEYCHIPLILLTAKDTLQSKIQGLEFGADAYVEKPFSPEFLQVQIANLLASRQKIRQYFASSPLLYLNSEIRDKTDEAFLVKLEHTIQQHLQEERLDVEQLAGFMCMSRPTLYRKIKALSDLTPNELINLVRLKKAAELLASGRYKIYEVATWVGYSSQTQFGRNFHKYFGMSPSEYRLSLT
ncbi:response regulator transcription factor [Olivibacter sitiensis]|uniref:response regulator transcription factor n=1 Tax=Olivibacter sitiensis TaxID=376470 RepID=UPI0003FF09AC|nr:response regulator [Olivibacter sitiensis]